MNLRSMINTCLSVSISEISLTALSWIALDGQHRVWQLAPSSYINSLEEDLVSVVLVKVNNNFCHANWKRGRLKTKQQLHNT